MEKNIDTIYSEMLAAFSEKSGYLPHSSCDLAARLYAAAAQLQALYHQARWVLDQSFPQTAQGAYLDQHAALRGLSRAVATRAAGVLRFGVSAAASGDLPIDAGTVCMTADGVRFATTEDAVLAAQVEPLEETVDEMCDALRERHIGRLKQGDCSIEGGVVFLDVLTNTERISDHCSNIAARIVGMSADDLDAHARKHTLLAGHDDEFNRQLEAARETYLAPLGIQPEA